VSLKYLSVSFNRIHSIAPISTLRELQVIDVSHNRINDISPLRDIPNLTVLRLHYNSIESLEAIRSSSALIELWVAKNRLQLVDFLHLLQLTNLQHIVTEGNPFEAKPKYIEFLLALCPSILTVNGAPAISLLPVSNQKHWYNPTEFLRTTDGRVMLTQARAQLTESQREFLNSLKSTPLQGVSVAASVDLEGATHCRGTLYRRDRNSILQTDSASSSGNSGDDSVLRAVSEGGKPIKYFKAKKKNTPKMFIQQNTELRNTDSSLPRGDASIVRFGEGSMAPVAVCVEEDGTGYARWARTGPTACSFDNQRLFSSHKNGSIAAVVDPSGNGSVMTPAGRCVLNIRVTKEGHVAEELTEDGTLIQNHHRRNIEATVEDKEDASVEQKSQEGDLNNSSVWKFDGMRVRFVPSTWEVCVEVTNSRVTAEFSSLKGGRIVTEHNEPSKPRKSGTSSNRSNVTKKKTELLSSDSHDNMREGLQSVMSALDDMLAGMKSK